MSLKTFFPSSSLLQRQSKLARFFGAKSGKSTPLKIYDEPTNALAYFTVEGKKFNLIAVLVTKF